MKHCYHLLLLIMSAAMYACQSSPADSTAEASYLIESIPMPEGLSSETGAIAFLPDGRLAACFHRGEVMLYDTEAKTWNLFAQGLHDPLGILPVSNDEMLVMQRPELTRVKDTDGDGRADLYATVTDDFGISGNYHEFNYGPVRDRKGNLFIGLNTASPNGDVRAEVRGQLDTRGRVPYQMFSAVPYRGWIMRLTPEGKLTPYASGFRSPNGLGLDMQGNLFVTDNQGDWLGTSTLYHVKENHFYGHPASLIWKEGWQQVNPADLPLEVLDSMRTKASVLFPHGIMANSPTQPLCDHTGGKFGPFQGQFFVGEMNQGRILRVMLEKVGGEWQGACIPFFDGQGLRKGNNRLAFAPDGSLWIGQNDHGWAGDRGIQRIVFTGKQPMEVYNMQLTSEGFDLTFTRELDLHAALDTSNYHMRHYNYAYHKEYGSEQYNMQKVAINSIAVDAEAKKVSLKLDTLREGLVYELSLGNITSSTGDTLAHQLICYTLNVLKK